jgi:isopropylmalate/homocitrate/citramalate synthase
MAMPKSVRIVDVGPRDGLQSEPGTVPTEVKVELIHQLANAGIPAVEAGAFVEQLTHSRQRALAVDESAQRLLQ